MRSIVNARTSSGGGRFGGSRFHITSTTTPVVTTPSGGTMTPQAITGETNRWYCDTPEWGVHTVTQTTGGVTATIPVNVNVCKIYEVADKTTFAGIQQILNAHMEADLLSVGDEMPEIALLPGNEPMVWCIGAINHEQQHQVIFVPKWCLTTARAMNTTATNSGGWNSCGTRNWLNTEFYNNLPDSVKPYIKERTFQTSQGSQSRSLQSATDKIWLAREYEILGSLGGYAVEEEHTEGGAEQFPIFATQSNRIKGLGKNGSANVWYTSSPTASYSSRFCSIGNTGSYYSAVDANTSCGIAPCFHMLADD